MLEKLGALLTSNPYRCSVLALSPSAASRLAIGLSHRSIFGAIVAVCAVAVGVVGLLYWSTSSVDQLAIARQRSLVANVLAQSSARVADEQESVTVWDDALQHLSAAALDLVWLDADLGIWMHDYFGHDATYVLDRNNQPMYAMIAGRRGVPSDFKRVSRQLLPMVRELREKMRSGSDEHVKAHFLTPGVTDNIILSGRPSIVSVEPIVSDTGNIAQTPGTEFVHISVRRLDTGLVDEIRDSYGFTAARFSISSRVVAGESAQPVRSRNGAIIGYFIWRHFAPGTAVFGKIAPVLATLFLAVAALVTWFMRRIALRTRELQESNAAVEHLAFHDPLTGLPNRALFEDRLRHALSVYRRTADHRVALLYLDLDRFKAINDTLGHSAGDKLICEFADRLRTCVAPTDTVARLGGDEFAIIQIDISSSGEIDELCERIIAAAEQPFNIDGLVAYVGVSVGVTLAGRDGLDISELTRKADVALYEAKGQGRGQYRLFAPAMDEPIRARQAAERDLRRALEADDQLAVVYQPTYSTTTGQIVGAEALIRWLHPTNGSVSPSVFIPIAEETGLIEQLGEWVLAQACRDARQWPIKTLSINVSPVQLRKPMFALRALRIIADAGIDPSRIEIEITETAILEDARQCATNLRTLREFGIRVALDDFGTGYSSFRHFNDFEVDRVKIDRTFVEQINLAEGGSAIIEAMVNLAHSSGFQTTAEGVETEEQRTFLEKVGCDDLQGFLLAQPIPKSDIDALFGDALLPEPADQTRSNMLAHLAERHRVAS